MDDIADLARRVRKMEDQLAIYQLISAHGPIIDTGTPAQIGAFYTEEGVYDTDVPGAGVARGPDGVGAVFDSPMHHQATTNGAGHTIGFPHVVVDGDTAVALAYTVLFLKIEGNWIVARVAANRFELERVGDGWKIVSRVNRLLGNAEAKSMLAEARFDLPWR